MNDLLHFKSLSDLEFVISSLEQMITKKCQGQLLTRAIKDREGKHPSDSLP